MKDRLNKLYIKIKPYLTPKMIPFIAMSWLITNGWAYLCLYIGTHYSIKWLATISGTYIAFLYFPFTAEKILTVWIATKLYKLFYKENFNYDRNMDGEQSIFKEDIKERVDENRNDNA